MRNVHPSFSNRRTAWRYFDAVASLQPERRQVHFRLLAQLHECETEVGVPMQVGLTDLVKDRHAAEIVAPFEKAAHEIVELIAGPDRIAECDPRAALHAVHDKRGSSRR